MELFYLRNHYKYAPGGKPFLGEGQSVLYVLDFSPCLSTCEQSLRETLESALTYFLHVEGLSSCYNSSM